MSVLLTAALVGGAATLLLPTHPSARLEAVLGRRPRRRVPARGQPDGEIHVPRRSSVLLASVTGGIGLAVVVGGVVGALLGAGTAVVAAVVLHRLEPAAVRRRRERLEADLPTAVDLLEACLLAGRPPTEALAAVAAAMAGPLTDDLGVVIVRLRLGADPVTVWREVAQPGGPLAPLGRTMARSLETGAPMADNLRLLAGDLRARRRAGAERRARGVGVRAAAPLGLCFLPAFVLVGVVPSVVGAFAAMSWW